MRFLRVRLQNFRNIEFAEVDLSSPRVFLLGANGQGKSNLLEGLGLVTALRSFRTQSLSSLPKRGQSNFTCVYEVEHEEEGTTTLEIFSRGGSRSVKLASNAVTRMSDFIGKFPVVALSSADLMILRGSPAERRRFIDLTLSAVDREYYRTLRDYHRGIAERNRLLKRGGSPAELTAFEIEIAPRALLLAKARAFGVEQVRSVLVEAYSEMADADEGPNLEFRESYPCESVDSYLRMLHDSRKRDSLIGSTQKGPHRDDFTLSIITGGAREYASDGQQRGLCVALRLAQARFFSEHLKASPVILADDVLGELDPIRRAGFWRACPTEFQIVATGTERPPSCVNGDWAEWSVLGGEFSRI